MFSVQSGERLGVSSQCQALKLVAVLIRSLISQSPVFSYSYSVHRMVLVLDDPRMFRVRVPFH